MAVVKIILLSMFFVLLLVFWVKRNEDFFKKYSLRMCYMMDTLWAICLVETIIAREDFATELICLIVWIANTIFSEKNIEDI